MIRMITFHKALKFQAQNCDIKLTTLDTEGIKRTFLVTGFKPYAFVNKDNVDKLDPSRQYITKIADEGYRFLFESEPVFTVYFQHPGVVGKQRDVIGPEYLHQADIHYELACAIKKGLGRYIRIIGDLNTKQLHIDQLEPMTEKEIEETTFLPYRKVLIDIEVLSDGENIPSTTETLFPVVSVVCKHKGKTIGYLLGKTDIKTISHSLYGFFAEIKEFDTEEALLISVHQFFSQFDVGLAWNSDFDKEYLTNRSKKLGLDIDWNTNQWFNLQQAVATAQQFSTSYLALKKMFDDIFMYKRHAWKFLPDLFQDYFSEEEGKSSSDKGKGMVTIHEDSTIFKYIKFRKAQSGGDVNELYENKKFRDLIFYNACDVWDMVMLENVGTVDSFFNLFDNLGLMNMNDVFFHKSKIEPSALRFCMLNKVASPSRRVQKGKIDKGAIVHKAKKGKILNDVVVTDFSRFYISIILAKQTSPENRNGNEDKLFRIMPNGEMLDEPMYFLPALAYYLINARNRAEDKALETDDILVKEFWKSQTRSLKSTTSGLWGYIAEASDIILDDFGEIDFKLSKKGGRYFAQHIGDEILAESRSKGISLKDYVENHLINGIKYEVVYGDSVRSNTPIMSRIDGKIKITEIQNIPFPCEVWTEKGWTDVKRVIQHRVKKEMFRILTHTGFIEVTEDHSLLDKQAKKISPKEVSIGTELLHSFPIIDDKTFCRHTHRNIDQAWCYGFFVADGSSGYYKNCDKYTWNISKSKEKLETVIDRFENAERMNFKILDVQKSSHVHRIVPYKNGYRSIKRIIEKYNKCYTDKRLKQIPEYILNSCSHIKRAFFEGYYYGDGDKSYATRMDTNSNILAQGLYKIVRDLDYKVSINTRIDKPNIIRLNVTTGKLRQDPNKIKKIVSLGICDEVVYDLETENHHFHAGIGQMIVHNTDSTFLVPKNKVDRENYDPIVIANEINVFFSDLCKKQGYPFPILVNAEKMYDRLLLVSKKLYYGRIVWEDGKWLENPYLDVKGMAAIRSDHSQLGKDFQYSLIQNHLEEGDPGIMKTISRMNKYIAQGFIDRKANFIEAISLPWKIKKPMEKYTSGKWKYYVESAEAWNEYIDKNKLGLDNRLGNGKNAFVLLIKYCGMADLTIKNKYLVFSQASLIDWTKIEIDEIIMKDKTVTEKIDNIYTSLGKDKIEIQTIGNGKRMQQARF